jgi:hypothetical protein
MRRLLDQLTATPAIVLGKRLDILEWNSAAAALYTDFSLIPAGRRNYVWLLFTDSVIRGMHREWEHDARDAVAALRMEAAADPDDPELARLVGELSVQDAEFRTWWAEHRVTSSSHGTKLYRHRLGGDLTLDCDMWSNPDGSGQRLMVLTAEPGSPSHDALRILTSWTAGQASANLVEGRAIDAAYQANYGNTSAIATTPQARSATIRIIPAPSPDQLKIISVKPTGRAG